MTFGIEVWRMDAHGGIMELHGATQRPTGAQRSLVSVSKGAVSRSSMNVCTVWARAWFSFVVAKRGGWSKYYITRSGQKKIDE
jgi:hypothetical protein